MKKIIIISVLALTLLSCKKERNCNCGMVMDDGIDSKGSWISVKSNCSKNTKRFYITLADWYNSQVGSEVCMGDEAAW